MNVRPLAVVIFLAFGSTFFARFKILNHDSTLLRMRLCQYAFEYLM